MAKSSHFFLGFILGGASALAATYLLTPQTSDELKRKFTQKKDDLADRAADYYDYARDATADWRESAADFVGGLKNKTQSKQSDDLADYDDATAALKDELTDAPEVSSNDDFDDIVVDGKSAFAQAKDDGTTPASEADPTPTPNDAAPTDSTNATDQSEN